MYEPLLLKQFPQIKERETAEGRYWKKFKASSELKHSYGVSGLSFSPNDMKSLSVACGPRVSVYDCKSNNLVRAYSRFKDKVYTTNYRSDGNLIVAGGEFPIVQVFDANRKTTLRAFKGHKGPVRCALFSPGKYNVLTASDDKNVKYWDLTSNSSLLTMTGHKDYVRCAAPSGASSHLWFTGSYDHTIRFWDLRDSASSSDGTKKSAFKLNHGAPVESVLVLPGKSMMLSAGGNTIKVWDILSGGKLVNQFSNHQKTITSLILDGTETRLMSGGLDGLVKIYDLQSFKVTHGLNYHSPILSLAVTKDNSYLAAGCTNGNLSIRHRVISKENKILNSLSSKDVAYPSARQVIRGGSYQHFARGIKSKALPSDYEVDHVRKQRLKPCDALLKAFKYQESLDAALDSKNPIIVVSLLEELLRRNGLKIAMSGRNEITLEPFVSFLIKFITKPNYSKLLIDVTHILFDLYASVIGQSVLFDELILKLRNKLSEEIKVQSKMLHLLGSLDVFMTTNSISRK